MAGIYNFPDARRNDTFVGATFVMQDGSATPVPLNLTGAVIDVCFVLQTSAAASRLVSGARKLHLSTTEGTVEIVDAAAGRWRIVPFVWTAASGTWDYAAQVTFADGRTKTYLKGTLEVEADLNC